MPNTNIVKEGSSASLTVSFFAPNGDPAAPASITYRIHDHASGNEIRGETEIAPGEEEMVIPITPDDTIIVNANSSQERRRVTVVASYGADDQLTDAFNFYVRSLVNYP